MIGVPGNNHAGSIELFGEHRPAQHMWPGGTTKGYNPLGFLPDICGVTIGTTNGKSRRCIATITPIADRHCGSARAIQIRVTTVQGGLVASVAVDCCHDAAFNANSIV